MLNLIDRYILKAHFAPFIFGFSTVVFIFLMQFVMNFLDQLVGKGLSEWVIIQLIAYNLAWMIILAVPMGVLFSTLMAFGSMSQAHEITIIKASGGSLLKMMFPVIIGGLIMSFALFWFNDVILPESNHRAKILMNDIQRKKPTFSIESGQFSTQLEGYTILSRKVDSITGVLLGVTIYDMTQFQRRNIISADTGIIKFSPDYKSLIINLYHGEVHQFNLFTVDNYRIVKFENYNISMPAQGFAYEQSSAEMVSRGDRELRISDMRTIVDSALSNRTTLFIQVDSVIKQTVDEILFQPAVKSSVNLTQEFLKPEMNLIPAKDQKKIIQKTGIKTQLQPKIIKPVQTKVTKEMFDSILKAKMEMNKRLASGNFQKEEVQVKKNDVKDSKNELIKSKPERIIAKPSIVKIKPKTNKKNQALTEHEPKMLDLNYPDTNRIAILSRVMQKANIKKSIIQGEVNQAEYYNSKIKQYEVEIYKKYSIPFACFVFVFVGVPLGVITRGGNFGLSAGISLLFYIFYWACLIAGEKLADRGIMASWLAMWLGNIVIGILGIILTLKVNYESIFIFNNNVIEKINKIKNKLIGLFKK